MGDSKVTVHLVHFYSRPGGIEVLLPLIITSMTKWEFKGFVIRKHIAGEPNVYQSLNTIVEYGSNSNPRALLKLFIYASKNRKDIFQVFNIGPVFLLALRLAGVKKLIYSIHGTIYWKSQIKRIFLKFLWKLALNSNYMLTSNTEYSRAVFLNKINRNFNIIVMYNPVNVMRFAPYEIIKKTECLRIVYIGRLCKGKNLNTWIDTANQIHSLLPNTVFEIYGSGHLDKLLQANIDKINANDYISLKGFRHDVENVYRESDLLLFLSEYESFGNVVVESILCGTPVMVSNIPSLREIFKDFPEFILNSDLNISKSVYEGLMNIEYLKRRALEARETFMTRFSQEAHIKILNELYQSCCG
jgi:glycosyltransferase involved in cell wall biosynthesis